MLQGPKYSPVGSLRVTEGLHIPKSLSPAPKVSLSRMPPMDPLEQRFKRAQSPTKEESHLLILRVCGSVSSGDTSPWCHPSSLPLPLNAH